MLERDAENHKGNYRIAQALFGINKKKPQLEQLVSALEHAEKAKAVSNDSKVELLCEEIQEAIETMSSKLEVEHISPKQEETPEIIIPDKSTSPEKKSQKMT